MSWIHSHTDLKPPLKALELFQSLLEAFGQSAACLRINTKSVLKLKERVKSANCVQKNQIQLKNKQKLSKL